MEKIVPLATPWENTHLTPALLEYWFPGVYW